MRSHAEGPQLSVIVATLGTAAVEATVDSVLASAAVAGSTVQTIVVWQSGAGAPALPGGVEVVEAFPVDLSHARNLGLVRARAEVIAFVDDDEVVDPGWVAGTLAAFADPAVDAAFGPVAPLDERGIAYCHFEGGGPPRRYSGTGTPPWRVGTGGNMAFRTAGLRALGGFDVRLGAGSPGLSGEDTDVIARLQRGGGQLLWTPDLVVYHPTKTAAERLASRYPYGFGMTRVAMRLRSRRLAAQSAMAVAYAAREVVRRRSRRRARELAETVRGMAAGVWRGREWLAPVPEPSDVPPAVAAALDGRRPVPRTVPHRGDPHYLYDAGADRVLHVYTTPDEPLRKAVEVRRMLAVRLPDLTGVPALHAAAEGRHALWVLEERLRGERVRPEQRARWWPLAVEWAVELSRARGPRLADTPWLDSARQSLPSAVQKRWRAPVAAAVGALADAPSVPAHGDLEPKNMLLDGDRLGVVDWEGAHPGLPPGFDLVFLAAMAHGHEPDAAALQALAAGREPAAGPVLEALAAAGAGPDRLPAVLWAVLALWCREEHRRLSQPGVPPQPPLYAPLLDAVGPVLPAPA